MTSLLPGCIISNWLICHYDHFVKTTVAATCAYTHAIERSSRAGYQSILVFTSLAKTCAGQSEHHSQPSPIRMPEWSSHLSGKRRILFTQPRGTHEHERRLLISFLRLYCPQYIFPPHLSVFCHRAILIWGDRGMVGSCS